MERQRQKKYTQGECRYCYGGGSEQKIERVTVENAVKMKAKTDRLNVAQSKITYNEVTEALEELRLQIVTKLPKFAYKPIFTFKKRMTHSAF